MPRRAAPGDSERIESALPPVMRAALARARETLDLVDWQLTQVAPLFQAIACVELAGSIMAQGTAPTEALHAAADHLGLSRETVRSWCYRWSKQSREKVQSARARSTHGVAELVRDVAVANSNGNAP